MVNIEDFIKRLEIMLDYYNLSASSFADKIGVQRSSLSHLLSGRNKPSLDFILKILAVFPDVDLYWILNGKGSFPKNEDNPTNDNEELLKAKIPTPSIVEMIPENLFSEITNLPNIDSKETKSISTPKSPYSSEVEKIVFFYKNGTFKVFNPN
ncbi:helix-turn-helix transcriptional regulator [Flavobacterium sp. 123]|uniref:helix-turn-helix domain-containing protein n=1 Tax=Flavobacterium sp. 123 TaxID=2135627 RepID=UPI000EB1B4D5|nr:helix-turn-helix transcriptional regulator [Flavobacterium sp. 123]RKT00782.1 helix-turn-helix protein [Flavobacterium sp. 123]